MGSHGANHSNETPVLSKFDLPDRNKNIFAVVAIVGFLLLCLGILRDSGRAYHAYLMSLYYFLGLTICAIVFCAINHVCNSGWNVTVRRIAESFWDFFVVIVFALAIFYFIHPSIYDWTRPDVLHRDHIIASKSGYLNSQFFAIRLVIILGLWGIFGYIIRGNSMKQDHDGKVERTLRNSRISAAFLPLFALSFSFLSFDLIMSLEAKFFSTMFAVYCFAGLFAAFFAMMILIVSYLHDKGYLRGFVNENHFHDLGKMMFAMTIFWAYVGFSQFMLIWYANLPEETFYFINRSVNGWKEVGFVLMLTKFVIPFLLLLPRNSKRHIPTLRKIAMLVAAAQLLDIYWMVMPSYLPNGPQFPWMEIGAFMGFLGTFILVIMRFLGRNNIVAIKDPRLHEALHLHQ